jgi:hypothetical protein
MYTNAQTSMATVLSYRDDFKNHLKNAIKGNGIVNNLNDDYFTDGFTLPSSLYDIIYNSIRPSENTGLKLDYEILRQPLLFDIAYQKNNVEYTAEKTTGGVKETVDYNSINQTSQFNKKEMLDYKKAHIINYYISLFNKIIIPDKNGIKKDINYDFAYKCIKCEHKDKTKPELKEIINKCICFKEDSRKRTIDIDNCEKYFEQGIIINEMDIMDFTNVLIEVIKIAWESIVLFMPLEIYGLPGKNIIEWSINCIIIGIDIPKASFPVVMMTHDAFGVVREHENRILREIISNHGIDLYDELQKTGGDDFIINLSSIVKASSLCSVVLSPTFKASELKDDDIRTTIADGMKSVADAFNLKDCKTHYSTIKEYAELYCDAFFNKQYSLVEIARSQFDKASNVKNRLKKLFENSKIDINILETEEANKKGLSGKRKLHFK